MVRSGNNTALARADSPTAASAPNRTTLGTSSSLPKILGPSSPQKATSEWVVPKSIPTMGSSVTLAMVKSLGAIAPVESFSMWMHELAQSGEYGVIVGWLFWIIASITLHELAHGWAALWQGDPTPRALGHMTASPMVHMGPMSLIALALVGIAWGAMR